MHMKPQLLSKEDNNWVRYNVVRLLTIHFPIHEMHYFHTICIQTHEAELIYIQCTYHVDLYTQ